MRRVGQGGGGRCHATARAAVGDDGPAGAAAAACAGHSHIRERPSLLAPPGRLPIKVQVRLVLV